VEDRRDLDPSATAAILLAAAKGVPSGKPLLLADGGVENFNWAVDELIGSGVLSRVLAQPRSPSRIP
jgi:hypothetical protein